MKPRKKTKYIKIMYNEKNGNITVEGLETNDKNAPTDEDFAKIVKKSLNLYKKDLKYLEDK